MKMNSCQYTDKILFYRLGLLSKTEVQEFEDHLKACPICQREIQIESAIDNELSLELHPGTIEAHVLTRIQLHNIMGVHSFWLYILRIAAYGVVAVIFGFTLIPQLIKFLSEEHFNIANLSELFAHTLGSLGIPIVITELGIILFIASTLYSLVYIRK
jgi:hypothetical protein